MSQPTETDRPAEFIERLDSTAIDLELHQAMAADKRRRYFDVIIEINLVHPGGREWVRDELIKWLQEATARNARCGVHLLKSEYSSRFIFASLARRQVRALIEHDRRPDHKWLVYKVWWDVEIESLLTESVRTVKADAARAAFAAAGSNVVWAVVDSGIQGDHQHFQQHRNLDLREPLQHADFTTAALSAESPHVPFEQLQDPAGHGTHVAGIIAGGNKGKDEAGDRRPVYASIRTRDVNNKTAHERKPLKSIWGVAPRCKLVSLRVLDERGKGKVSNIIAALGYIQKINNHGRWLHIHGVNLSVGYEFEAEAFACGHSPLCVAVDRLVRSGVVVVTAAGNSGYGPVLVGKRGGKSFRTSQDLTINDPGNAEMAITVGATHREKPHMYGVSYFSSRGPTADGRWKPDLVAPGEKIISCAADSKTESIDGLACTYREDSGTSMAAPHVSGAVAAFLSIRKEFMGEPERVKEIFLATATDLGRERYFQGHGLLDLMRAIQSV